MSSPAKRLLEDYVAGRTGAAAFVQGFVTAHYRDGVRGGPAWQALLESIEHQAPGLAELARRPDAPGFDVRAGGRALAAGTDGPLRAAAEQALAEWPGELESSAAPPRSSSAPAAAPSSWAAAGPSTPVLSPVLPASGPPRTPEPAAPGIWRRLLERLRRWFSA